MGIYTSLRVKVIVKPEYREELARIANIDYEWEESQFDLMANFGHHPRSTFIPCGALIDAPSTWEDKDGKPTDDFNRDFDKETGLWSFQCSLKNYQSTIETFFSNLLSFIVDKVIHIEVYDKDESMFYDIVDGVIQKKAYNPYLAYINEEDMRWLDIL